MVKPLLAAGTLLFGGAAAGTAIYIQANPRAFTTTFEPVLPPPISAEVALPELVLEDALPKIVELEPVRITAPVPKAPETPIATQPCSEWRELGPKASASAGGAHNVRMLCM